MIEKPGTWGQVDVGTTILSPTALPLVIVETATTPKGLWYRAHDHERRSYRIAPKPSEAAVTILECTADEAELLAMEGFRAERLLDMERERRMPERAKQWLVPAFPTRNYRGVLNKAKDHLSWYHAVYTTDIRTLKQAQEAHDEMHTDHFMDMPHTHREA